jgi:hypothetical protein
MIRNKGKKIPNKERRFYGHVVQVMKSRIPQETSFTPIALTNETILYGHAIH